MVQRRKKKLTINKGKYPLTMLFSELVGRASLAASMGKQYGTSRDVYQALGYPSENEMTFRNYLGKYVRMDMAKAIIDRPVKASWKGKLEVIENAEKEKTSFEEAVEKIMKDLKLKSVFMRADKLTGLGEYSILLLGLNDTRKKDDFAKPVNKNRKNKLLYVKPLSQESAKIAEYEENITSKRFGLPTYYTITTNKIGKDGARSSISIRVHHSRVIHLVEDILEDEVHGTPRLQAVYNRLIDLEKLVGGDAEMFWRGARPGYTGTVKDDFQMTTEGLKDLESQIDEFEHNLRRVLINEGVDYKAFEQQIADPTGHVEIQMQMISAVTGIPKRILIGSERGELSSAQDRQEWIAYVSSRREEQNEPMILIPFIDRLIELNLVPKVDNYEIVWDKLFTMSDVEKANMGKVRSIALKEYSINPIVQEMVPLNMFLEYFLGLDDVQIKRIEEQQTDAVYGEGTLTDEEVKLLKTKTGVDYRSPVGESYNIE
ncbi:MAG: anti-CBASS protein Acb1 family protein [bacterium]